MLRSSQACELIGKLRNRKKPITRSALTMYMKLGLPFKNVRCKCGRPHLVFKKMEIEQWFSTYKTESTLN